MIIAIAAFATLALGIAIGWHLPKPFYVTITSGGVKVSVGKLSEIDLKFPENVMINLGSEESNKRFEGRMERLFISNEPSDGS